MPIASISGTYCSVFVVYVAVVIDNPVVPITSALGPSTQFCAEITLPSEKGPGVSPSAMRIVFWASETMFHLYRKGNNVRLFGKGTRLLYCARVKI